MNNEKITVDNFNEFIKKTSIKLLLDRWKHLLINIPEGEKLSFAIHLEMLRDDILIAFGSFNDEKFKNFIKGLSDE